MKPPRSLPPDSKAYRRTPTFSADTIPAGLRRDHQTKRGTWGLIQIISGELEYTITESGFEASMVLSTDAPGVVVPEQKHHVAPLGAVEFFVEFYRSESGEAGTELGDE